MVEEVEGVENVEGVEGVEGRITSTSSTNKKRLSFLTTFCDPDWIRTNGLQLRRLPLYPTELQDRFFLSECKDNFF